MITNEVLVTIFQAYLFFPRHIRKDMLIRWIITSDLCTAVGWQQFRKQSRKLQRRIKLCLNVTTPCTIIIVVLQTLPDVPQIVI